MRPIWIVGLLLCAIVALAAVAWGFGFLSRARALEAPDGVTLTPLRSIGSWESALLLRLAGVSSIPVAYTVDCYRLEYASRDQKGRAVTMSGLLALPRDVVAKRLVSFQHGTTTTRDAVPSRPDGTGIATAIAFAGNGYALVVPDYPGLGSSTGRHPYYVEAAIGRAVAEMIARAQRVKGVPSGPVFLAGFSEGAWASLAALRILEADNVEVLGSAQVAGPYDLRHISLPAALKGGATSHSLYLAYAAWGQSDYYGHTLDSVLTPHYATVTEHVFDGGTPDDIIDALPKDPRRLFNSNFLKAFDENGSHWFLETFAANSLSDVTPRAPVRLYYGSQDRDVVPEESIAAARGMTSRGADVEAIDVGPVGHDPSMVAAAPLILEWLKTFDAQE